MPKISSLGELETQIKDMCFCPMNKAVLVDKHSNKKIIITGGIATCLIVIIHHPQSTLTLFSHINSSDNILVAQNNFILLFNKKGIPLHELHVYLAGGLRSFFESEQAANLLKNFWEEQSVILNTDLLLSRDGILVTDIKDFFGSISELFKKVYCEILKISFLDFENFLKESEGFIYDRNRFESRNYRSNKEQTYSTIEVGVGESIKNYLRVRGICEEAYMKQNKLLMAQFIHNPQNTDEKRVIVSFHDPHKSVLHLVGFNIGINELFIATDDCAQLMDSVADGTEKMLLETTSTISIVDLSSQKNSYDDKKKSSFKGFIVTKSGDAHDNLIKDIKQVIDRDVNNLGRYLELVSQKQYGKALRTACNSCKPTGDENTFELIKILLSYKDIFSININEENSESKTAIYYAALKGNEAVYNLLIANGANEGNAKNILEQSFQRKEHYVMI
jgi:hypothetical protein